jgi:hypothetical protein
LPSVALAGRRPVAVFLAPLTGALLAGLSGFLVVALAGDVLRWFVPLAISANAAALASFAGRHGRPPGPAESAPQGARRGDRAGTRVEPVLAVGGLLLVIGALSWCLRTLVRPDIGFDTRTIWLVHARWLAEGHGVARAALGNPALPFAHSSYPPLSGAVVALGWLLTGAHTASAQADRTATVVIALLTACAVGAAATSILEVGLRCGSAVRGPAGSACSVLAALGGAAWVLGTYGIAGAGATNGYVDLLWSASAVAAAGFGLVAAPTGRAVRAAAVLAAVAALTKNEGVAAALILVLLIVARWWRHSARRGVPWAGRRWQVAWGSLGLAGVVSWPVTTVLLHALPDPDTAGRRQGTLWTRTDATARSMADDLHIAALALAVGILATVVLAGRRRSLAMGGDPWIWALGGFEVLAVASFYVFGKTNIRFWLGTSVDRTTIFPEILGLASLGWWLACAAGLPRWTRGARTDYTSAHDDLRPPVRAQL